MSEQEFPKQWIVIRKDLNMRKGKMVSQGAHASLKVIFEQLLYGPDEGKYTLWASDALRKWIDGRFTKITLGVSSEKELLELYDKVRNAGIMCALIQDVGTTEFHGIPTYTCIAIGPEYPSKASLFVEHLSLL